MAPCTESEPVFISRCETVGLSSEAVSKLEEASINTLMRWHLCHPAPRGAASDAELVEVLDEALGKESDAEQNSILEGERLFHEAYAVATQELKTMAERPDKAGPRRLFQPEASREVSQDQGFGVWHRHQGPQRTSRCFA